MTTPRRTSPGAGGWAAVRDRVELAEVARLLMGDPEGRKGERGRRLWWRCPFHEDHNPSFCIDPGRPSWHCFGCRAHGDAAELVMRFRRVSFREAVMFLVREFRLDAFDGTPPSPPRPRRTPRRTDQREMAACQAAALALVTQAAARIWTPDGQAGLDELQARGLNDATIRLARLGWAPDASLPRPGGGRTSRFEGITIPWFGRDGLELVKVRQPDGCEPRYTQVFRRRPTVYPGPPFPSLPHHDAVIVAEGELDALLLCQELEGLAVVITTGSASERPDEQTLRQLDSAYRLFLATDADDAGDRCVSAWPKRAMRLRAPEAPLTWTGPRPKDWTEAHQAGVKLRWWWIRHLVSDPYDVEERAAIMEYDGHLTREAAEDAASRQAYLF